MSWVIASRFAAVHSICFRKFTFTLLRVTSAFLLFVQSAYAKSASSVLKPQTSDLFRHSELLYYSYKLVVKTSKLIDLPPKSRKIWRFFGLCPQNDNKMLPIKMDNKIQRRKSNPLGEKPSQNFQQKRLPKKEVFFKIWARRDSNPRPKDYESSALPLRHRPVA